MYTNKRSNATFILEFVIAIFFFMIAAAVLSKVYANTAVAVNTSRQETEAYLQMRSVASVYSYNKGDVEGVFSTLEKCGYYPLREDENIVLYFDSAWSPLQSEENFVYKAVIKETQDKENYKSAQLAIICTEKEIPLAEIELAAAEL